MAEVKYHTYLKIVVSTSLEIRRYIFEIVRLDYYFLSLDGAIYIHTAKIHLVSSFVIINYSIYLQI